MMKTKARGCELCGQEAFLHCAADSAFLCFDCDARVHQANFLVARHLRQTLCCQCKCLTGKFVSGERSPLLSQPICPSCSNENLVGAATIASSATSSDCISSTESSAATAIKKTIRSKRTIEQRKRVNTSSSSVSDISGEISSTPPRLTGDIISKNKKRDKMADSKAEGIFVIWCKRMGLSGNSVISLARQALDLCLKRSTVLPFRVSLAASFWLGLRMCGDRSLGTWQNLRKLETVSGVPAKLIVAVETKLARAMTLRRTSRQDLEEGSAEWNV
ncbi:Zinc finger, B-box [Melia azedarach]|uniref:Zinc finger, B-box n=1 Tax=Melia azedarach TaxID=155640 RepID=A0ACC1Y4Y4_MELAZ|nr:Zinc finger, B-box [Melia azedarach]